MRTAVDVIDVVPTEARNPGMFRSETKTAFTVILTSSRIQLRRAEGEELNYAIAP